MAAEMTGKEDALYCGSGTMANYVALLTHCKRGEKVLVGTNSHLYKNEKAPFMKDWGGLDPVFFEEDKQGFPNVSNVEEELGNADIKLMCLENTHNFMGGTCLSPQHMKALCDAAHKKGVPVHLDGARIFNAAVYLNVPLEKLVKGADTLMFCLSKGLSAPVGSVLCGSNEFIAQARQVRKLLGGTMRQAGVIATAGIVSLNSLVTRLEEDHRNASLLAKEIARKGHVQIEVEKTQTNIVKLDLSQTKFSAKELEQLLFDNGLKVKRVSDHYLRLTTYREIQEDDIYRAAAIFNESVEELEEKIRVSDG
ncbi:GntG family PLP-dependent aldolase [Planococcus versutus]|uniref:GntG family PLP-dependent aldolase n=1 Tax=Planococcus versutus TaxID=1302659 RepID=UPI0009F9CC3C|nr:GntG family PLP-dependent aldolase [Planococcus versutus]